MVASLACWRVSMAAASTPQLPAMLPRQYARDANKWSRYNMLFTFRNDVSMIDGLTSYLFSNSLTNF